MGLYTNGEIDIRASRSDVWKVLTSSEYTKEYMFGCNVICDWQIGSEILWRGAEDGVIYVKGELLALDEEKKFAFTVFDPGSKYEDIHENYLTAEYSLEDLDGGTRLKVTQGDYDKVDDGQNRYEETMSYGGWKPVLDGIKKIAEAL